MLRWVSAKNSGEYSPASFYRQTRPPTVDLLDSWLLADCLGMTELQNAIMDFINFQYTDKDMQLDVSSLNGLYDRTSVGSPVRKMLVDICAWLGPTDWIERNVGHFPVVMLGSITTTLRQRSEGVLPPDSPVLNSRNYHVTENTARTSFPGREFVHVIIKKPLPGPPHPYPRYVTGGR